jgi:FRG domain
VAHIEKPGVFSGDANNVSELLQQVTIWHDRNRINAPDVHLLVWYRGHSDQTYILWPSVYRAEFTAASKTMYGKGAEKKRLNLERHMLDEFRTSGATLLNPDAKVEVYFVAQHSGMPTRLLDWTMNPLAALFFAVKGRNEDKDGELLIMDASKLLPSEPDVPKSKPEVPKSIVGIRHPYATEAIGVSFWEPKVSSLPPLVLPIRPDNQVGRIGQQSSCSTLHMHGAKPRNNPTLGRIRIPGKAKPGMLDELRKLNINEFSIYNDLDHLAQEIRD